jgi:hypothetical protein
VAHFLGPGYSIDYTPDALSAFETALVADLRAAAGRYPADSRLRSLIAELHEKSDRFAELWDDAAVGIHDAARKTIDHQIVGPLTLDCDVLSVAGSDLRIMVYTAEPGSEDAERLALLMVVGTQAIGAAQ